MSKILIIFVVFRFAQYLIEKHLSKLNRQYYLNPIRQKQAMESLNIDRPDMDLAVAYSTDKYKTAQWSGWIHITVLMVFLASGVLGQIEALAQSSVGSGGVTTGMVFFAILGLMMILYSVPFSYYNTFVIEERHGFNKQTKKGFVLDLIKGLLVGALLGGAILSAILLIMKYTGDYWWVFAWFAMSGFSILTAWLYPTFLAPLFNKFRPLEESELKTKIFELAKKCDFDASGLSVMDASIRSSHGNAYFTGMFKKKKIVLFDTLVEALKVDEVVAVLAHELGHFKLNHVRWMLIRSVLTTGVTFYLLSLCLPLEQFYRAFGLEGISNYGALVVFSLWFGLVGFVIQPVETYLSRKNEFAADKFALSHVSRGDDLGDALLKLRQKSHSMPISHPVFSAFYYSHPPMMERLAAMDYGTKL